MTDLDNYNVYQNKDGRYRAYNKITHKVTSYPRVLMESILGIQLLPTEDVHHKDEDYTNNNPDNLEVISHLEHEKQHARIKKESGKLKYYDKQMICPVCNKEFTWTTRQQMNYNHRTTITANSRKYERQPPCCCKSCAGKYAAAIQYNKLI